LLERKSDPMDGRTNRVAETIKREISFMLQEKINDPRIRNITIVKVEMTGDLMLAKVFYETSLDDEKEKRKLVKGLKKASGFIRTELASRISMKFSPQISFREASPKEKVSIEYILNKIKEENIETKDKNVKGGYSE